MNANKWRTNIDKYLNFRKMLFVGVRHVIYTQTVHILWTKIRKMLFFFGFFKNLKYQDKNIKNNFFWSFGIFWDLTTHSFREFNCCFGPEVSWEKSNFENFWRKTRKLLFFWKMIWHKNLPTIQNYLRY